MTSSEEGILSLRHQERVFLDDVIRGGYSKKTSLEEGIIVWRHQRRVF